MENDLQKRMEDAIKCNIDTYFTEGGTHLYDRMRPGFVACCASERWLTIRYPVQEWQLNHMKTMHGGLIATAFDTTCGMAALTLSQNHIIPTINLTVHYLSPGMEQDALLVTAKVDRLGKHLIHVSAECKSESNGKLIATAMASFINAEKQ